MINEENILIQKILQNLYAVHKASPGSELDAKGLAKSCGIEDPDDIRLINCLKKLTHHGFVDATSFYIEATEPVERVARITAEGVTLVEDQKRLNQLYRI